MVLTEDPQTASFGAHTCSFYQNRTQQFASVVPFIREGLLGNRKCVYVIDERSVSDVLYEFRRQSLELGPYLLTKQMVFLTKHETYLAGGHFEPERMLHLIEDLERSAIGGGYTGLYGVAEMTWSLDAPSVPEKLIAYESLLNVTIPGSVSKVLCLYNDDRFPEQTLTDVVRTHPFIHVHGDAVRENTYFFTPPQYMRTSDPYAAKAYREMIRELQSVQC